MVNEIEMIDRGDGAKLAVRRIAGRGPAFIWLCGFKSDMSGTKAAFLSDWARAQGRAFVRFDYSGHGRSEGDFEDCDITRWRADALAAIDTAPEGPLVLVGSSMGAWIALLAAQARPARVKALLLVAPAADFTEALLAPNLPKEARDALAQTGRWERPSAYGDGPYVITQRLIDDGRKWLLLEDRISFAGPVRILQGMADPDVPWTHAAKTLDRIASPDARMILMKDGDHRLSTPRDLALLQETAEEIAALLA